MFGLENLVAKNQVSLNIAYQTCEINMYKVHAVRHFTTLSDKSDNSAFAVRFNEAKGRKQCIFSPFGVMRSKFSVYLKVHLLSYALHQEQDVTYME